MKSVFNKLKNSITNNIVLKIAAVFIAAIIWLAVVNLSDPTKTITIYGVPIELTNQTAVTEQNKVFTVDDKLTMNVTITGKRSDISGISASDFKAVAPLDELSVVNSVQVEVSVINSRIANRIAIINQSVKAVSVNVEDLVDKEYNVEVDIEGNIANGYYLDGYTSARDKIIVTAPESIHEQISRAAVLVDISGERQDFQNKYPIKLYDKNGNIIKNSSITKSYKKSNIYVTILRGVKVPVTVAYSGQPANNYIATTTEYNPESVIVVGREDALSKVTEIEIPETVIDISGAKQDVVTDIDLSDYLPDGVSVPESENSTISVTVKIEKLETKKISLDNSDISIQNLGSGLTATITNSSVSVELIGQKSVLDNITADDINASIDLKDIKEGTKTVDLSIENIEDVQIKKDISVKVKITKK